LHDPEGVLHSQLFQELLRLTDELVQSGPQLSRDATHRFLAACSALEPRWKNEMDDSSDFFSWLMQSIDLSGDRSVPVTRPDVWEMVRGFPRSRPAYRPEEEANFAHLEALSRGESPQTLQQHCVEHWQAHLMSGHRSQATQVCGIQLVDIYECSCDTCPTTRRDITYAHHVVLEIPQDTIPDRAIPMKTLVDSSLETWFSVPGSTVAVSSDKQLSGDVAVSCPNDKIHYGSSGAPTGRLERKVTRVARAPPLFAVEINRFRRPRPGTVGGNFFSNRITNYATLRMQDWSNDGPSVRDKPELGASYPGHEPLEGNNVDSQYELVGIIAYSPVIKHYTSFVRIDGRWVYFDDLQSAPVEQDPFASWPKNFYESMLFYKVVGQDEEFDAEDDVVMTTEGDARAQPQSLESVTAQHPPQHGSLAPEDEDATLSVTLNHVKAVLQSVSPSKALKWDNDYSKWFKSYITSSGVETGTGRASEEQEKTPKRGVVRRGSQAWHKVKDFAAGRQKEASEPGTPSKTAKPQELGTPTSSREQESRGGEGVIRQVARRLSGNLLGGKAAKPGLRDRTKTPDPESPSRKAGPAQAAEPSKAQLGSPAKSSVVSTSDPPRPKVPRPSETVQSRKHSKRPLPGQQPPLPSPPRKRSRTDVSTADPIGPEEFGDDDIKDEDLPPDLFTSAPAPSSDASPYLPESSALGAGSSRRTLTRSEAHHDLASAAKTRPKIGFAGLRGRFSRHQKRRIISDDEEEEEDTQSKKSKTEEKNLGKSQGTDDKKKKK